MLIQRTRHVELELELELIQARMIQKPLLWVEVGKSACVLVGICELRTRNTLHFWTFSLGVWSASYGPVCLRQILHGMLNRSRPIIEHSSF